EHRALRVVTELLRLLERDPHGVDAAHLPGADSARLALLRKADRVRADETADLPREDEVAKLLVADRARDDGERIGGLVLGVALLQQEAAEHALEVELARLGPALA